MKAGIAETYGKLPLSFEANQGQTDRRVKFLSRGHGYTLFLTPTQLVLAVTKSSGQAAEIDPLKARRSGQTKTLATVLRIKLEGSNPRAQVEGVDELPGESNYFIGSDPRKWRTNVGTYARVRYRQVYPGVDLVYYGNQRQVEYDFVVSPGSNPGRIVLGFRGADKLGVDGEGNLVLETAGGAVELRRPAIYQEIDGVRRQISGGYVRKGARRVGFELAAYDAGKPLIIDPVLSYSTYLGGSGFDFGGRIAVDGAGNAYVTGETASTNFPTTPGAFQTTYGGGQVDAFVAKLDSTGSTLLYSTYLGGNNFDDGTGIAVDSAGNAYVTGETNSTNFPTTPGAFQTASGTGGSFVTKLDPTGSSLLYSTFLGGAGCLGIAVDSSGNAYLGCGSSGGLPTTPGAFQTTYLGPPPGVGNGGAVAKLNPAGTALVYATYLSGSSGFVGTATGIAVDASGNAYVVGQTNYTDFPTTPGAFQTAFGGGVTNGYVAKLNPNGTGLVYSTYLGGSGGLDQTNGIAVDAAGSAYVTGNTASTNFPTTPGAFQTTFGGGNFDAFVTKLNPFGTGLVYSTYLGGGDFDNGGGIAVDSAGQAYVAGTTRSTNFPTVNPVQAAFGGTVDAFVTKINTAGTALIYSTYLGGSGDDEGSAIALDGLGNAYIAGFTNSTNFPTTTGAFQTAFGGGSSDVFVAKVTSAVAFASFSTSLEITNNLTAFELDGNFTLGTGSNGINPLTEAVSLQVGTFSTTIPAGSFTQDEEGNFKFEGVINGVSLEFEIVPLGNNAFEFKAEGKGGDLTGTVNPVTVQLTIGDDRGSVAVAAEFE